jgi:Glycosyl transferase family 2
MSAQGILMESADRIASPRAARDTGTISVVIPVVERADDVTAVYQAFSRELDAQGHDHEFLLVFDGRCTPPTDLVELSRDNPGLRILRFAREFGETAALRLGVEKSRGDVVLTLPAYFQVQPEGIGLLLDAVASGADMAVANRSPRLDSWLNRMQSRMFHSIVGGVSGQRFHDMACGVRAMRRSVAEALPLYGDLHRFQRWPCARATACRSWPFPSIRVTRRPGSIGLASTCGGSSISPPSSSWPSSPKSRCVSLDWSVHSSSGEEQYWAWCC